MISFKIWSLPLLLIALFFSGCTSIYHERNHVKQYKDHISGKQCEEAQVVIPLEKDETKYLRFYKSTIGYTASLSILPATLVLDFILMGRCQYGCNESERTFMESLFPTTTYTYEHTKELRCPDNSYYIIKLIEVAECFENRGDKPSLETAYSQLMFLSTQYHSIPTCIQIRDGQVIDHVRDRVEKKLVHIN